MKQNVTYTEENRKDNYINMKISCTCIHRPLHPSMRQVQVQVHVQVHVHVPKVIHIHHDLRKMFITLVWNDQQSFDLHYISYTCSVFPKARLACSLRALNTNRKWVWW